MIIYQVERTFEDNLTRIVQYDVIDYPDVMHNTTAGTGNTDIFVPGCTHTATLAVCTVLVIFVLFLGCTGNGIVLFNALTSKRLRNNFDLLVINLAGADFIMCTCLSPIFLFLLFSDSTIPIVFCGSILFLGVTSGMLSLLSLVCLAVHRQCLVVGHIKRPLTLIQTSVVVGIVWLISISLALGSTLHVTSAWSEGVLSECENVINGHDSVSRNFVLYFLSPIASICLTTIATCYAIIARVVRLQNRNGQDMAVTRNNGYLDVTHCDTLTNDSHNFPGLMTNRAVPPPTDHYPDNGSRATGMCCVVTITVSLCWAPIVIAQFIEILVGDSIILYQVKLCGMALIFLNSALDPYIYGQTNRRIKHKYARMLYNFARCEYSVHPTAKLKRTHQRTLEACPLKCSPGTQDTSTIVPCNGCDSPNPHRKSHKPRFCYNNKNYAHNLLLMNCPQTNLCNDDIY